MHSPIIIIISKPHDTKEKFTVHSIIRLREVRKNETGKVSTTLQQGLGSLDGDDDFANLPPHQKALLLFVNDGSHTRVEDVRQRFSKEPVNGVEKRIYDKCITRLASIQSIPTHALGG